MLAFYLLTKPHDILFAPPYNTNAIASQRGSPGLSQSSHKLLDYHHQDNTNSPASPEQTLTAEDYTCSDKALNNNKGNVIENGRASLTTLNHRAKKIDSSPWKAESLTS